MNRIKSVLLLLSIYFAHLSGVYSQADKKFDVEVEMLSLLNGEYVDSIEKIKWVPYPKEIVSTSEDGFAYTAIDSVFSYQSGNEKYVLVVLRTNVIYEGMDEHCASCSPTLGLTLFKLIEGKYTLMSMDRSVCKIGQAGMLPDYSLIDLSAEVKGFLVNEANFQDSDVYSQVYALGESNVSNLVFEYPNFRMLNYEEGKYQNTTLEILTDKLGFDSFYLFELRTETFKSDKLLSKKSTRYSFNGRKWEPLETK